LKLSRFILRFIKFIVKAILPCKYYENLCKIYDKLRSLSLRRYLLLKINIIRRYSFGKLPRGVNLFLHRMENSAGTIGHLLQQALEVTGIPYQIIDLHNHNKKEQKNIKLQHKHCRLPC